MFHELNEIPLREIIPGYKARFVHTGNVTIGYWTVTAGAVLPQHSHIHQQTSMVTKGKFQLTVGSEVKVLESGMVAVIPPNVKHAAIALTACEIIDVFYPEREDYK